MRILHVVPSYLPAVRYGGPIYSVHGLAKAQAALGHDVHVFTTNVDGPSVSPVPVGTKVALDGVNVWYFESGLGRRLYRSPSMKGALQRDIKSFDIVHLHSVFLWPTLCAARIAEREGVPYLLAPRGMLVADLINKKSRLLKSAWIKLFERRTIERAAALHVTAQIEADEIARMGFAPKRVVVAPNGIDISSMSTTSEATSRAKPYVLSLGRISWKKGLDTLISAIALVPDAELVIAGNDEEGLLPELEALAKSAGVNHRVRFVGPVHGEEKWELLRNADVFVLASHNENFGIAVLEAMACAVPVVVTPGVGLAPQVKAASAGLIANGDPESMAGALKELLAAPQKRSEMGFAGRRLAETEFSWPGIASSMISVYETLRRSQSARN